MLHATSANASPRPSGDRSRQPLASPFGGGDREQFAQRFLRVAQQLDALQPVRPHPPSSTPESRVPDSLLPAAFSRERVMGIFRQNARFRPCEAVARSTAAVVASAPPTEPRNLRLKTNAPKRQVAVTNAMPHASAPSAAATSALYPAVGGKARALPLTELARMKEALRKRSLALANAHSAVSTTPVAVVSSEDSALQVAKEGEKEGGDGDSVQHGKQALVAKLVQLSGFSATHIFQLSRLFKATAGAVKSVIDFEDFHQVLSAGMATLLPSPPPPALPQHVDHDLRVAEQQEGQSGDQPELDAPPSENPDLVAIGETIASSETFVRRLFQAFDTDGDGHIDVREFIVGLNGVVTGNAEDKVAALFEIYRNDHPPPAATAPEGKNAVSRQPKVPITELLGLFQGDRQRYQELMRCVEDYFVRVQLDDDATMTADQFVSASLAEPRLLRHVSRSVASGRQRESDDPTRRELLHQLVARARLCWETLVRIQRRMKTTTSISADELIQIVVEEAQQQTSGGEGVQQLESESEASTLSMEELTQSLVLMYRATSPSQVPTRGVGAPELEDSGSLQADDDLLKDLAGALQTSSLAASAPDATADQARFFFEHFDVDGDGRMTQHELAAGLGARMGAQVLDVARLLEDEDDDQDGQLSPEEYLRAAHKSPLILASLYTCL
ncbi:hypothetical protein BBJ28_00003262 [Nothophytophthora sp. Chile5]|nr:hypothetical protein BBJ28_00003262 [Nothophytophthora sp. Chile5]